MGTAYEGKGIGDGCVAVFVTTPSAESAEKLARGLVEKRLAACVSTVAGVRSMFWWKGKIDHADEFILICKTRSELSGRLTEYVRENHEYEVPEVVVLPIVGGNTDYLQWVKESTVE